MFIYQANTIVEPKTCIWHDYCLDVAAALTSVSDLLTIHSKIIITQTQIRTSNATNHTYIHNYPMHIHINMLFCMHEPLCMPIHTCIHRILNTRTHTYAALHKLPLFSSTISMNSQFDSLEYSFYHTRASQNYNNILVRASLQQIYHVTEAVQAVVGTGCC